MTNLKFLMASSVALIAIAACATATQETVAPTPVAPVVEPAPSGPVAAAADTIRYEWDLGDLYASPEAWEAAYQTTLADAKGLTKYKGTLGRNAQSMLTAFQAVSSVQKEALRIFVYATLSFDEDQRVAASQERSGKADTLMQELGAATSWMSPELLKTGEARTKTFLAREAGLAPFKFMIEDTLRRAPYTLDEKGEQMLADSSQALGQAGNIYGLYANASIEWPTITLSDGTQAKLNQAGYGRWRQVDNRADRKAVFDAFWGAWKSYENGMGATLNAQVLSAVYRAKARGFDSTLERNMFDDALPDAIYTQLVEQVNASLPSFHRYLKLRAKLLGVTDLAYYDIYPAIVKADMGVFDLKRSEEITFEALKPFGDEYLGLLREGLDAKWMHSHPQEGKQSGAYVFGSAYDVHPYVLLNHNDDYDSMSTYAHEWGHAVHTQLARANNPFETFSYSTFIAEMASTISEILLQEYMIANARTKEEKLYYLDAALEQARGTFYRQTMFGEFELAIHEAAERGEPLTGAKMSQIYGDLLKKYHGHDQGVMTIDDTYAVEWAFIPHFYREFYVYQYATSISGATWFAEQFLAGDTGVRDNFLNVLKAGGSSHPHDILLRNAGLDMTRPDAYQAVVRRMNNIMDRMDTLLAE